MTTTSIRFLIACNLLIEQSLHFRPTCQRSALEYDRTQDHVNTTDEITSSDKDFSYVSLWVPCWCLFSLHTLHLLAAVHWRYRSQNTLPCQNIRLLTMESENRHALWKSSRSLWQNVPYYLVQVVLVAVVALPTIFYIFQPDHPSHATLNEWVSFYCSSKCLVFAPLSSHTARFGSKQQGTKEKTWCTN